MRTHFAGLEVYSSFVALRNKFGSPNLVLYAVSSGNVILAYAEYGGYSAQVGSITVAEASFLSDFPNATALIGPFTPVTLD